MAEASSYFPYVFDLSSGTVQRIQTSAQDPRVTLDKDGLEGTDASGAQLVDIDTADGTATFKGTITASGLVLPAGSSSSPPTASRVQWTRANGAVTAEIFNYWAGSQSQIEIISTTQGPAEASVAILGAQDDQGSNLAGIKAQQNARGAQASVAAVIAGKGQKVIYDQNQASDFLQLLSTGVPIALDYGTNIATFTASSVSAGKVVNHFLGRTPQAILVTCRDLPTVMAWFETTSRTATQFTVFGQLTAAATLNVQFDWIAIG